MCEEQEGTSFSPLSSPLRLFFAASVSREYFQTTTEHQSDLPDPPYQHQRKNNSIWTPPDGRNYNLDFYIHSFRNNAQTDIIRKRQQATHNLSRAEHHAIQSLKNNLDIVIKPADKGGAVVIMNKADYNQEATRQLSNTTFYKPLPSDPTLDYQKKLHCLLKSLPTATREQILTESPSDPRPGLFYLLPKIHKPGHPGRPIISGIGTLTTGLSSYVDTLLKPFVTNTPSYLRDTTDFLRKLQNIDNLPNNTILATMDVEALYTNIPHEDGLQAIRNTIPEDTTANLIADLCNFVLTHNYFRFENNLYLQISGTAMGTRMAPQYANIFMADLEQRFLNSRPLSPLLYLRYIDDIFMIWTHGQETLEIFHRDFNNLHPTINLSLDHSTREIHFLDTTVQINNGKLDTTLYRKPTDSYSYLHASSSHPEHTTRSIVYSQALRYNRICSNPTDRDQKLQDLYQAFINLNYPPRETKKQIERARRIPRNHLLQDRPKKTNNRTPLVITYNPQLKPVQHIINKLQPILEQDTILKEALGDRPIVSYRQPPNLKMILTNHHRTYHTNTNPGTFPCNKPRCQLCPHIHSADTIIGPNQVSYKIKNTYSCASRNIIYAIMCRKCPSAMYIGQTSQTLRQRINAHKTDIRQDHKEKTVSCHFNQKGHSLNDLATCILLQRPFTSALERESSELSFMLKFDTYHQGLNKSLNFLTHYQDSFPNYHL
uniref:Reverse transcriptase domain-containing protein n=1 Tax=Pelodiscus sinensis TaxID=13735 RepID=K7G6Y6_PELSI